MRVLHVVPRLNPQSGGPSIALPGLARCLANHGIDTTLLTTTAGSNGRLDVPLNQPVMRDGVAYVLHHVLAIGGRYGLSPSMWKTLRRTIVTYDIVHIHFLYDFSSTAAARAAIAVGVPFVVQPAGSLDPYLLRKNQLMKRIYLATLGRPLLTRAAAVVFTSEQERALASYGPRRPEWIVPVGLDVHACAASGCFSRRVSSRRRTVSAVRRPTEPAEGARSSARRLRPPGSRARGSPAGAGRPGPGGLWRAPSGPQ